jgi:hypothetical protein
VTIEHLIDEGSHDDRDSVFTPGNEPYLGRESVHQFDVTIVSALRENAEIAACTQKNSGSLTELQFAACQIVPQGINLALSIRELVRQGYLFAAIVLMRSLIERAAMISYLDMHREQVALWKNGWLYRERPSLATMLDAMAGQNAVEAKEICDLFNHITHGDPTGASWNLVELDSGGLGYSVGKVLNNPQLCDFICFQSYCYMLVLTSRARVIFEPLLRQGAE